MSALADLLRVAAESLEAGGHGYALVGGLAVSALTDPRFTRDVDLAVAVADDGEAEQVVQELSATLRPLAVQEHETLQRLAMVRLGSAIAGDEHTTPVVDLLFAEAGIEPEIVAAAQPVDVFDGVTVPLAAVGHLIAMKVLAVTERRRVDEQDLIHLLDVATDADIEMAVEAVQLITERGANRGKDLLEDLRSYVRRYREE